MITLLKGENRIVSVQVEQIRGTETFTIDTAEYEVEDIQDGSCYIDNTNKIVSFYADTSLLGYMKGKKYIVEFTVTLQELPKIIKGRVVLNIV